MLVSRLDIPRIPTTTIRRERLERWLQMHEQTPLRLLLAPAGSGKTSLLLKYANARVGNVAYCALAQGAPPEELYLAIARALGRDHVPQCYEDVVNMISNVAKDAPFELIVDDAGDGEEETTSRLHQLVEDIHDNVSLIYAARCGDRIGSGRLISRGVAEACDARRINFDAEDARLLAERCNARPSDHELHRLIAQTDGWALATCATIRTSAIENETLSAAYVRWRADAEQFLHEFVTTELERVSRDEADIFRALLAGNSQADPMTLRRLQARGLHVIEDGMGGLRPYHPLRHKVATKTSQAQAQTQTFPLLSIKMLGAFHARFGNREIPWVRRRDQQIIKYLAMKPDGRATRAELRNAFWKGTDHHLAVQSMRTAFSTIRRALAAVVGYDQVEWYFRTSPDVHLVLDHVVSDVRRFASHIADAEACFERNESQEAAFHYRAAEKLYAGDLLEFEAPEPWFAAQATALRERYILALERLADAALDSGDRKEAREYAARAAKLAPSLPSVVSLLHRTHPTAGDAGGIKTSAKARALVTT